MVGQQSESLTAKLRTNVREQLDAADALTKDELQQHAQRLTKQCSDVLSQTESVISGQSQSLQGLQSEARRTIDALKSTLEAARSLELSMADQHQIRDRLTAQITAQQAQAIGASVQPLQQSLQQLNREAAALSRTTAQSWLKPLLIGVGIATGISVVVAGGLKVADVLIAKRAEQLQALNERITEQRMTLTRLQGSTWGVDLQILDGQQYIVLPQGRTTDGKRWTVGDRQAIKVE